MKIINLAGAWSYCTCKVTIDFPAGSHEVDDETYDAAVEAGVHSEGKTSGNRTAKASASADSISLEG